jgi:hypothetical protein
MKRDLLLQKITRITKNHDTTQMVLTNLNIAWAYFDTSFNKGFISILSINTIQIWQ